jgi:uncharacterized protein YbaP (TraB family)
MSQLIDQIEKEQLKQDVPSFGPGDTVVVQVRVKEGDRERLQAYEGLDEADEVWTESEISADAALRSMVEMSRVLQSPPEMPLTERVPEPHVPRLLAAAAQIGVPHNRLEAMRPWMLGMMLMQTLARDTQHTPDAGVDRQVHAYAQAAGKTLRWLEDVGPEATEALPEAVQVQFLLYALDDFERGVEGIAESDARWRAGDLAWLADTDVVPLRTRYPELYDWIAVARNAAWMEVLRAEMGGAGVDFVVVGNAHLVGPHSLVALFEAQGYVVERVGTAE